MPKQYDANNDMGSYDANVSDSTVMRLSRKLFEGVEYLDLRQWRKDKSGKLYATHKGVCMRHSFWKLALQLFKDNALPYDTETNS